MLPADAGEKAQVEQWMDWQATELNNAWRYAFMALVREGPDSAEPQALVAGMANLNRHMQMLDAHLSRTGAYATVARFTLADIVLGLSTHRWMMTPMERPQLPPWKITLHA